MCMQGVKDKEVIAGELAAAEVSLSATPRGAALMRKYGPALAPALALTLAHTLAHARSPTLPVLADAC